MDWRERDRKSAERGRDLRTFADEDLLRQVEQAAQAFNESGGATERDKLVWALVLYSIGQQAAFSGAPSDLGVVLRHYKVDSADTGGIIQEAQRRLAAETESRAVQAHIGTFLGSEMGDIKTRLIAAAEQIRQSAGEE